MQIGDLPRTQHTREGRDSAALQAMRILLVIGLMTGGSLALWLSTGSSVAPGGMITAAPPQILAGERRIAEMPQQVKRVQVADADPAPVNATSDASSEAAYLTASGPVDAPHALATASVGPLADEQVPVAPQQVRTDRDQPVPAPPADVNMTGAVTPRASLAEPPPSAGPAANPVDLNRASLEQLNSLKGAGALGRAIVKGRPYRSVDDLVKKKVLRRAVYEKIKDQITVQ